MLTLWFGGTAVENFVSLNRCQQSDQTLAEMVIYQPTVRDNTCITCIILFDIVKGAVT